MAKQYDSVHASLRNFGAKLLGASALVSSVVLFQNCGQNQGAASQDANGSQSLGGAPTVSLAGDTAAPVAAYSINQKIVTAYPNSSPLFKAVRIPDMQTTDVLQAGQGSFANGSGVPDTTQIAAWLASSPRANSFALVTIVYDQSGHGNNATQTLIGAAPKLRIDPLLPANANLALVFGNETAAVHAGYASDLTNGSGMAIKSLTTGNPTTLTLLPSPLPKLKGYPKGAPFPQLPAADYWVLPGFLIQDMSLPTQGLGVLSETSSSFVLNGQASETNKFSKSITIVPTKVWLDLPSTLSVNMNSHTMMMAVRPGYLATQYYMTLGQSGEAKVKAGAYSSLLSNSGSFTLAAYDPAVNPPAQSASLASGSTSTDIDVYEVSRADGTVSYNLGEMGSDTANDNYTSTATLSSGSIGYTQQNVLNGGQGSFEAYGVLIYGTALSANDTLMIQTSLKSSLGVPTTIAPTQIIYTGESTVVGHGIDSVEAPAKRISLDMVQMSHRVRTFTGGGLSEDLLADLTSGGPITNLYKQGAGTNIIVMHPTIADSFGAYQTGSWPPQCGAVNSMPYENCLWTVVSQSIGLAHQMGWKILLLGTEPKSFAFSGTSPLTVANFLAFKALEVNGWKAAGADGYADLESNDAIGGSDGKGGMSHCPFWNSGCVSYSDPGQTQVYWQPDGGHLSQAGYDITADTISAALVSLGLY